MPLESTNYHANCEWGSEVCGRSVICHMHKVDMPWCSQMPAGAFEAAGEWEHLVSALAEPGALSLADSRTSASALCACLRSGSWSLAVSLWESFRQVGLRPDVVAMDSVISACASSEMWALGCFFLLESEGTRSRSPLQFLWALAELGISDKFVIASTCREVFLSFYSSRWTAADVALYGWSAAMLGVSCAALSKSMTKYLSQFSWPYVLACLPDRLYTSNTVRWSGTSPFRSVRGSRCPRTSASGSLLSWRCFKSRSWWA